MAALNEAFSIAPSERALMSNGNSLVSLTQVGISPQRTSIAWRSGKFEPGMRGGPDSAISTGCVGAML